MKLNLKQTKALDYLEDKITNEGLYGGAAGGGKSVIGSYWLLKNCLKYEGSRWLMGRAKLKTLKETTLNSFLWVSSQQGLKANQHFKINQQTNAIQFLNGSCIFMKDLFYYPSDPNFDELGSLEITGAFIDECNQITEKAWNVTMSRIRYMLDENNIIPKIFGTCNPSKNFVYNKFYKPYKQNTLDKDKFFIQALVTDNPNISKHYIDNLGKLDPISKARLLDGNWEYDNDPAVLMEYEKIVDLFTNDFVPNGLKYITSDIARLGEDNTIIRVWDGLRSIKKVKMPKSRTPEIVNQIKKLQSEYSVANSNTICDEDGVGGGVVDTLKCKGFVNNSKPIEVKGQNNYTNLRSQCYFKLADIVNNNQMFLSDLNVMDRETITDELGAIKQKDIDKDGKLSIISREEIVKIIGHSPDEASTLMMRMWFELKEKPTFKGHRVL